MSIYDRLGVPTIINAAGTATRLGGTIMLPEVREAVSEAAKALATIEDLQAAASKVIAAKCGSEAGCVTSGAASGLTLATAACMTRLDVLKMEELPHPRDGRDEVIICRTHRNSYDHAFRAAGARLVEVGVSDRAVGVGVREPEVWEIEAAITERTVAVAYTAGSNAYPPLPAVTAMAKRHDVPVIVDAAGQLPPPSNLRRFITEGADLVSFSGGKALRGPQGTGILAGRRDLVAAAVLQQLDMDVTFDLWDPPESLIPKSKLKGAPHHGIGRGYKVAKEQIVGLIVALELFTEERCRRDWERWMGVLSIIQDGLSACHHTKVSMIMPALELGFPLLEIQLDEKALGKTASEVVVESRRGSPPIYFSEKGVPKGSIWIHPVNLCEADARQIVARLTVILG